MNAFWLTYNTQPSPPLPHLRFPVG
jgi:hypothetical protein